MSPSPTTERGFTLTELAVVMAIVALLMASLMYTLSAQSEQRALDRTNERLAQAKELLITFAIVNGRLPCPAAAPPQGPFNNATGTGTESISGGTCTDNYTGFLPGKTIGFAPVDSAGYALDAWNNPIRYAVSSTTWTSGAATGRFTTAHTTTPWSVAQSPGDLVICGGWGASTTTCGTASSVTNQNVVVAVIWSQGKNFTSNAGTNIANGGASSDEQANNKHRLPSAQNNNPVFVWRTPAPQGSPAGEYDDLMTWIPVSMLYGRMVAAGVLP